MSALVLWVLLPAGSNVALLMFAGAYATAMTAAVVSHVPGGLGVFESLMVLALPSVPADQLLGSLLAWRAVYLLLPLLVATVLFGGEELRAQRSTLARIEQLAAAYICADRAAGQRRAGVRRGLLAAGHGRDTLDRPAPDAAAERAAARGARGLAPGIERDRPGAADPGAGAVPPLCTRPIS